MTRTTRYPRIDYLAEAAAAYARAHGRTPADRALLARVYARRDRGEAIGRAYLAAPDPVGVQADYVRAAYRRFAIELSDQYRYLTEHLGVRVTVTPDDPYDTAAAMADDLRERRLAVLATESTGGHPLLANRDNDRFRAVHDAFGHAALGRGFDRHGEEAAWAAHARMFSPLARLAMTSETRGQSSAFVWVNRGVVFPPQRAVILPARFSDPTRVSVRPNLSAPARTVAHV